MSTRILGPQKTWMTRDEDGHREFHVVHHVTDDGVPLPSGPFKVAQTPGLFLPGAAWQQAGTVGNDLDLFSWFRANLVVKRKIEDDGKCTEWLVEQFASSKPPSNDRCQDTPIEDPLLEPQKLSGGSIKYVEEARYDRFGSPITTSAREQIRGPQVEFDANRHQVRIEQNVAVLNAPLCLSMVDTVNVAPLWGFQKRCIKLSDFQWERKIYGTCFFYFSRTFVFDIDYKTFDKDIPDEGTMCLRGAWDLDPNSAKFHTYVLAPGVPTKVTSTTRPADIIRFQDWHGNLGPVRLNGHGRPYDPSPDSGTGDDTEGTVHVEKYGESDFTLLGIPTIIGP